MRYANSLLSLIIIFSACAVKRPQPVINQGLTGYIYLLSGNQMPGPGRPQSKGRALSCTVYIYAPTTTAQTEGASPLFSHIKTRLIAQTQSDSTGHYAIKLAPGKYSVFIAQGDRYFAAGSDGTGILNPVIISKKSILQKNFTININAAY